jgi:hypothetical protein
MPAVTSRPGCGQMMLGSEKLQLHKVIPVFMPGLVTDSMPIRDVNPVEPISVYPCMKHP